MLTGLCYNQRFWGLVNAVTPRARRLLPDFPLARMFHSELIWGGAGHNA